MFSRAAGNWFIPKTGLFLILAQVGFTTQVFTVNAKSNSSNRPATNTAVNMNQSIDNLINKSIIQQTNYPWRHSHISQSTMASEPLRCSRCNINRSSREMWNKKRSMSRNRWVHDLRNIMLEENKREDQSGHCVLVSAESNNDKSMKSTVIENGQAKRGVSNDITGDKIRESNHPKICTAGNIPKIFKPSWLNDGFRECGHKLFNHIVTSCFDSWF